MGVPRSSGIARHRGTYPAAQRGLIWKTLLSLPYNVNAYAAGRGSRSTRESVWLEQPQHAHFTLSSPGAP